MTEIPVDTGASSPNSKQPLRQARASVNNTDAQASMGLSGLSFPGLPKGFSQGIYTLNYSKKPHMIYNDYSLIKAVGSPGFWRFKRAHPFVYPQPPHTDTAPWGSN